MTEQEIENIGFTEGLIAGAKLFDYSNRNDEKLVLALARGVSARCPSISETDIEFIKEIPENDFFDIQTLLCDVIPNLDIPPTEMMRLSETLVIKGGQNFFANKPYSAFREWCSEKTARSETIINQARQGNTLALRHLVFAIQAANDFQEALMSAKSDGEERNAGILALSRMQLDLNQAKQALSISLSAANQSSTIEKVGLIKAVLEIAETHSEIDRSGIIKTFKNISDSTDANIIHLMATTLFMYAKSISNAEAKICLNGIKNIYIKNQGTVREIEHALRVQWSRRPTEVNSILSKLMFWLNIPDTSRRDKLFTNRGANHEPETQLQAISTRI